MAKRDASCPLCGAKLTAAQVLDACEETVAPGVIGCRCPFCQGYFEARPTTDAIEIGYLQGERFAAVMRLAAPGIGVLRDTAGGTMLVKLAGRQWRFEA